MATKTTASTIKAPAKKKAAAKKSAAKKESGDRCWEGYEAVPGKKPGSKGSCKKKES